MELRMNGERSLVPCSLGALQKPCPGCSVWPQQRCWFCRYANFHLQEGTALEVGVCCWPKAQMD